MSLLPAAAPFFFIVVVVFFSKARSSIGEAHTNNELESRFYFYDKVPSCFELARRSKNPIRCMITTGIKEQTGYLAVFYDHDYSYLIEKERITSKNIKLLKNSIKYGGNIVKIVFPPALDPSLSLYFSFPITLEKKFP